MIVINLVVEVLSFGEGTGRIWLTDVECTGNERELRNCTATLNETSSCTHAQDAGLRCVPGNSYIPMIMLAIIYVIIFSLVKDALKELFD